MFVLSEISKVTGLTYVKDRRLILKRLTQNLSLPLKSFWIPSEKVPLTRSSHLISWAEQHNWCLSYLELDMNSDLWL